MRKWAANEVKKGGESKILDWPIRYPILSATRRGFNASRVCAFGLQCQPDIFFLGGEGKLSGFTGGGEEVEKNEERKIGGGKLLSLGCA